jgi:hypothetical protein
MPSKGMRCWFGDREWSGFVGWWAVSWDRPWPGVAYIRAMLSGFDLWVKCTSSVELEIHLNGRVLGIGQVTVWSSHVEYGAW